MEADIRRDPATRLIQVLATIPEHDIVYLLPEAILHRISELIAEKFAEEIYQQVIAKIDLTAIANLVSSKAATSIANTYDKETTLQRNNEKYRY